MNRDLFISALRISVLAGRKIFEIYQTDFSVEYKNDHSPLTAADKASHEIIISELNKSGYPVLSEEGKEIDYEIRKYWENFWLVDPLDGTKEFVKRNGEFTVNIAFMSGKSPVFGIIYSPVSDVVVAGIEKSVYSLKGAEAIDLRDSELDRFILNTKNNFSSDEIKVAASRSHVTAETAKYISGLNKNGEKISIVNAGSALKFCLLAEGKADVYPRFWPTMEWDTAAGHAILKACGKNIRLYPSNIEMTYNKPSLVNGWFIAR